MVIELVAENDELSTYLPTTVARMEASVVERSSLAIRRNDNARVESADVVALLRGRPRTDARLLALRRDRLSLNLAVSDFIRHAAVLLLSVLVLRLGVISHFACDRLVRGLRVLLVEVGLLVRGRQASGLQLLRLVFHLSPVKSLFPPSQPP